MAYSPYYATWHDADSVTGGGDTSTPLVAAALQHIEDGIGVVAGDADTNTAAIAALSDDFPSAVAIAASAHDVPVWNGSAWVRASGTPTAATVLKGDGSWAVPAPAVTALPGSPVDGQEILFMDSLTAPTYAWRLRYISGKSSDKWAFVGGSAKKTALSASSSQAVSAVTAVPNSPSLTVPVAGLYRTTWQGEAQQTGSGGEDMRIWVNGSTSGIIGTTWIFGTFIDQFEGGIAEGTEDLSWAAETLTLKCQTQSGGVGVARNTVYAHFSITLTPLFVGG